MEKASIATARSRLAIEFACLVARIRARNTPCPAPRIRRVLMSSANTWSLGRDRDDALGGAREGHREAWASRDDPSSGDHAQSDTRAAVAASFQRTSSAPQCFSLNQGILIAA